MVFGAHYVKDSREKQEFYHGVKVVYTKEFKSTNIYSEGYIAPISIDYNVKVAISDWAKQLIILE